MMPSSKHKVNTPSTAVSLEAKKKEPNARGRSCLDPGHQPLKGRSFYLDVRKQAAKLKKDLEDLGGTVETFLSKDINYVVSDRPEVQLECRKNAKTVAQSDASPAVSTPSPFQQSKDSVHKDSPSAPGGREGVVTRGKAIVQKATTSQLFGTSNVLANARNWNVSIRYIDSVLKYINKEKQKMKDSGSQTPQVRNQQTREKTSSQAGRKLSRPCLKVEDSSCHYRPAVKEMTLWPRLTFDGHDAACPFNSREDIPTRGKRKIHEPRGLQKDDDADSCHEAVKADEVPKMTQPKTTPRAGRRGGMKAQNAPGRQRDVLKDVKRGYCECCHIKYSDLEKHLASEQHRNFVSENNHYVNLDAMIDEGPNIEQFLNDVMQHHEWQRIEGIRTMHILDDVTLISSPSEAQKTNVCVRQSGRLSQQEQQQEQQQQQEQRQEQQQQEEQQQEQQQQEQQQQEQQQEQQQQQDQQQEQQQQDRAKAQGSASLRPASTASSTDTILNQTSKNDCPVADTQENERDLSCPDHLGASAHSRNSPDHLSPTVRHLSILTCEMQMSPATLCVGDSQSPPKNQHEETNPLQLQLSPGKPSSERQTLPNPPESCQKRSKLSLSAKRKQKQEHMGSPARKPSTQENSDSETPHKTLLEKSLRAPTDNTAIKNQRRLRLSLTARKRLLKERNSSQETTGKGNNSKSLQDTSVCVDDSGTNTDQKMQDPALIQRQSTSENTKNCQEIGSNEAARDTGVSISEDQLQRVSNQSDSLRRRSKRKRSCSYHHESRSPKQRIIETVNQAQRKADSVGTGDCLLEKNPANPSESVQNTVSMGQDPGNTCSNLPSVFCSDPNKIESSFLGFSSDEITETELRLQQLSASPTMYASKLQEAALNVCCVPSSELQMPDENDLLSETSDTSDLEEAVVGMALRNLDNFPSEGSEWEAKVGGFMSVRLDTALQLKQTESALTKVCIQEKENLGENQYQQIVSSPNKIVIVETREQNTSRQLEQSPRATGRVLATAIPPNDAKSSSHKRVLSFDSCNKTNPQKRKADEAKSTFRRGFPSAYCPPETAPPTAGSTVSPVKPRKPVCSTPKRTSKSPRNGNYNLVFSPDTPKEDREIIVEHYVHDVTEDEIDFPKISSPLQSNFIVSPIKNFSRSVSKASRRSLGSQFKYKDSQAVKELSRVVSPRRSLFPRRRHSTSSMPAKVFHFLLNPPGSPRKREESPSLPSSPFKQRAPIVSHPTASQSQPEPLHQISYIPTNEHNKVSPIFFSNSKPHFSPRILHPDIKRRRSDRLRRPSSQSSVDIHTSPHRPRRTWSLSVLGDAISCSRDVYEFRDNKGFRRNSKANQMGSPAKSGNNPRLLRVQVASPQNIAMAPETNKKLADHQTDLPKKQVLQEYGLPLSFFM